MKYLVLLIIRIYQKTISPDHGVLSRLHPYGYCKFYPSCSEYGHQAISHHGLIKGGWLATKRVFRCNPFSAGGEDQIPRKLKNYPEG